MMSEQEMKSMEQYALDILKNNPSPKWVTVLQTESGSMVFSFDDLTGEDTAAALKKCGETWVKKQLLFVPPAFVRLAPESVICC